MTKEQLVVGQKYKSTLHSNCLYLCVANRVGEVFVLINLTTNAVCGDGKGGYSDGFIESMYPVDDNGKPILKQYSYADLKTWAPEGTYKIYENFLLDARLTVLVCGKTGRRTILYFNASSRRLYLADESWDGYSFVSVPAEKITFTISSSQ
jgi:hypothetical protein